jgi:hypothetical protein
MDKHIKIEIQTNGTLVDLKRNLNDILIQLDSIDVDQINPKTHALIEGKRNGQFIQATLIELV